MDENVYATLRFPALKDYFEANERMLEARQRMNLKAEAEDMAGFMEAGQEFVKAANDRNEARKRYLEAKG